MEKFSKEWFELSDLTRRKFSKGAWIPIYGHKTISEHGEYPDNGYYSETISIGAAAIFLPNRTAAEKLEWSDLYVMDHASYLLDKKGYIEVTSFLDRTESPIGFRMVISQYLNRSHLRRVEINQDFVYAYGLVREGNNWVRPHSGYEIVIKAETNENGEIIYIVVRGEYLRDYLAARGAVFRLYYYRERDCVLEEKPDFGWPEEYIISDDLHNRCEVRWHEIDQTGDIPGSTWAVFSSKRTDVDHEEEIPDFSNTNDDDFESSSRTGVRKTETIRYRVMGELWRGEWIEPAKKSQRLGFEEPEEDFLVSIDASGDRISLESLNIETIGRYLWFDASLIELLTSKRGGSLQWYSQETGSVSASVDRGIHFGINELGNLNAYAYDVARLSLWERRLWAGKNIPPDGGVSKELLKVQMECETPATLSSEQKLDKAVEWLNACCIEKYGMPILREHPEIQDLKSKIHRFRSLDESGLKGLAKDVVKFSIERLEKSKLKEIVKPNNEKLGTLKLLQSLLTSVTSEEFAKSHMAPLFGVYDLRGTDAHLSTSDVQSCFDRIQLNTSLPFVWQGAQLIGNVADTIGVIGTQIKKTI